MEIICFLTFSLAFYIFIWTGLFANIKRLKRGGGGGGDPSNFKSVTMKLGKVIIWVENQNCKKLPISG